MKKMNRKGFTIVELVIVIAVVAILAAVLIPTFSNVISKANHSAALQEARNKYLEVFADDIAEDGVLNITVTEAEEKGYTYTTADGKVTSFTFDKDGITVKYNVANDDWTVNGESQGGTGDNNNDDDNEGGNVCDHTPEADDGNCATAVVCTECRAVVTAAITHNFTGDWEKNETGHWHVCKNVGCNQRQDFAEHTPGEAPTEDAAQTCTICDYVIAPALDHTHNYTIPGYDETNHWLACTCGDKSSVTAHTAAADDGDCTSAIKCTGCEFVITAAKAHDFTGEWQKNATHHWHVCQNDGCDKSQDPAKHTAAADDGNCITAIYCTECHAETTAAKAHSFTNYVSDNNATCTANGTKTADCDNDDCNQKQTITDEGSKKGHNYVNLTCTTCGSSVVDNTVSAYLSFDSAPTDVQGSLSYIDGKLGKCANFENGYVQIENLQPGTDSFTLSMWVKNNGIIGDPVIVGNKKWDSSSQGFIVAWDQNDGGVLLFHASYGSDSANRRDVRYTLPDDIKNDWIHIAVVVNRETGKVQFYVNFELITDDKTYDKFPDDGNDTRDLFDDSISLNGMVDGNEVQNLYIGQDATGKYADLGSTFKAYVDEFIYFNGALTDDDVDALKAYYGIGN